MVPPDMQARELGPFASARQLVQGRAAAMAARTEKILKDADAAREAEEARHRCCCHCCCCWPTRLHAAIAALLSAQHAGQSPAGCQ